MHPNECFGLWCPPKNIKRAEAGVAHGKSPNVPRFAKKRYNANGEKPLQKLLQNGYKIENGHLDTQNELQTCVCGTHAKMGQKKV